MRIFASFRHHITATPPQDLIFTTILCGFQQNCQHPPMCPMCSRGLVQNLWGWHSDSFTYTPRAPCVPGVWSRTSGADIQIASRIPHVHHVFLGSGPEPLGLTFRQPHVVHVLPQVWCTGLVQNLWGWHSTGGMCPCLGLSFSVSFTVGN